MFALDLEALERCKRHTHKGYREKVLKVMNFGVFSGWFQGNFRVFPGSFRVFSRYLQYVFSVFSGCFPYALFGYAVWTTQTGPVQIRLWVWN